jgi:hypothetical protein
MKIGLAVLALATIGASACGSGGGTSGAIIDGTGSYYPLAVGNSWTFQETATDGTVSSEVVSVVAQEMVGGTGPNAALTAFRVVTGNKVNDPNGDSDWEAEVQTPDLRVVRYREVNVGEGKGLEKNEAYWDPPRLRCDEAADRIIASASWEEDPYTEYDTDVDSDADGGTFIPDGGMTSSVEDDIWSVIGVDETVTVLAGKFKTLHVKRINKDSSDGVKEFWFARGVGRVKEIGDGKPTHVLSSYHVVSP